MLKRQPSLKDKLYAPKPAKEAEKVEKKKK